MQIIEQTKKEKIAMYMKLPKKEIIEMLINCNDMFMQKNDGIYNIENTRNLTTKVKTNFKN